MPLAEVLFDFYDKLKSTSRGYASFDYEIIGYRPTKLAKLDILINGKPVDALSQLVYEPTAYERARKVCERLSQEPSPRQQFKIAIQGAIGGQGHRARDHQPAAQGRPRQVLRRRHLAQAQAPREAERGQEAHEDGRRRRAAAGGLPGRAARERGQGKVASCLRRASRLRGEPGPRPCALPLESLHIPKLPPPVLHLDQEAVEEVLGKACGLCPSGRGQRR